jgi:hypothetical protein
VELRNKPKESAADQRNRSTEASQLIRGTDQQKQVSWSEEQINRSKSADQRNRSTEASQLIRGTDQQKQVSWSEKQGNNRSADQRERSTEQVSWSEKQVKTYRIIYGHQYSIQTRMMKTARSWVKYYPAKFSTNILKKVSSTFYLLINTESESKLGLAHE